ncbi:MAG TPA: hypothetical protein DDY14_02180 [Chromatiaceae bacterium]|jgi:hypothetical protein|nr:hypothetical protein [Chromatiaceae bacterium]
MESCTAEAHSMETIATMSHSCIHIAFIVILYSTLALPRVVSADERPLWGYGVRGCSDYLLACQAEENGDAAEFQRYEDWLTGFISGLNLATGEDLLRGSGIESAMSRTQAHCKDHQDDDFFNASMEFVRSLASLK